MSEETGQAYLEEVRRQFRGNKRLAEGALAQISDDEFFRAPDEESNSIAIIVQHMTGNMRSRFTDFLASDGEKPWRHRDREFEMDEKTRREDLMRVWEESWKVVLDAVGGLSPVDLLRPIAIRGEKYTALQGINRQLAHYAYHVGQIVFLAKHWRGKKFQSLSIPRGQSESAAALAAEKKWHKERAAK